MSNNKTAQQFSKAANSYHQSSLVQKKMAEDFFRWCEKYFPRNARVIEFGAGTGHLTSLLVQSPKVASVLALDLSEEMLEQCAHNLKNPSCLTTIAADIETWVPETRSDVIISNATLQWIRNSDAFFKHLDSYIETGTQIMCNTFAPGTLNELYTSYNQTQRSIFDVPVVYHTEESLRSSLSCGNLTLVEKKEYSIVEFFETPRELLRTLRKNGTAASASGAMTKSSLRKLEEYYIEHYAVENHIPCTWNAISFVAVKNQDQ